MEIRNHRPVLYWLYLGCALIYLMVLIGGLTRLTHSGLSMVDWSIFGSLPPTSQEKWEALFDQYKQYPEYQKVNFNFSVDEFKRIFWWEYIHRMLGRTIGIVFIVPFIYFLYRKMISKELLPKLLLLLVLGGLQGFIGWFMVKSGLNKEPQVSHFRLALHLISAFTVFGFTFWTALGLQRHDVTKSALSPGLVSARKLGMILFTVVIVQIIYGAFVAGLKAGYICQTWPKMCGSWWHESVLAADPIWKNFTHAPMGVQFVHRTIAILVIFLTMFIWYRLRKSTPPVQIKKASNGLLLITSMQFLLGVITILYLSKAPVLLGALHQTGAFFLFAACLYFLNSFKSAQHEER